MDSRRIRDIGVSTQTASATPFGTWNGSNTSAQLVDAYGRPISKASVSAIHRTDWQGRQLLYPTARSNYFGGVIGATGWTALPNCTITPNAALGPDGVTSNAAQIVVTSAGSGGTYGTCLFNATAGTMNTHSLWVKGAAGGETVQLKDPSVTNTIATVTLTNLWARYYFNDTAQTTGGGLWIVAPPSSTIYAANGQMEIAASPTSWINNPTYDGAAITITDYTITGTTVNLAQAPVATATTDWDGTGFSNLGQNIAFTSSAASYSAPMDAQTFYLRAAATAACMLSVQANQVANPQDLYIAPNERGVYLNVTPGCIVSVKGISGSGNLSVQECSL